MSATVSESSSPQSEPQTSARRKRIVRLAVIVFEFMRERYQGGTNHEYDEVEDADLIAALRACSAYTDHISCLPFDDVFVIEIQGVDGHTYLIQFSLSGPGISLHAARVTVTKLSLLAGHTSQVDSTSTTFDILEEYSKRLELGKVTADMAFLVGMSLVLGFIEPQGEERDERLEPLIRWVAPRAEELRLIRTKLPPSSINYDEEGEQPF